MEERSKFAPWKDGREKRIKGLARWRREREMGLEAATTSIGRTDVERP